jgi:hypothetical protein
MWLNANVSSGSSAHDAGAALKRRFGPFVTSDDAPRGSSHFERYFSMSSYTAERAFGAHNKQWCLYNQSRSSGKK